MSEVSAGAAQSWLSILQSRVVIHLHCARCYDVHGTFTHITELTHTSEYLPESTETLDGNKVSLKSQEAHLEGHSESNYDTSMDTTVLIQQPQVNRECESTTVIIVNVATLPIGTSTPVREERTDSICELPFLPPSLPPHTYTHTHVHTHTHLSYLSLPLSLPLPPSFFLSSSLTHTHTHHTHTHTCHTHACMHMQTHAHTHTQHTHIYTHIHTHTYKHIHTHTHTNT